MSAHHENIKLLCHAIPGNFDYKDLMNLCVCNLTERSCMVHLCENCPDIDTLTNCLKQTFNENDFDDDDVVKYKQWISTDRTTLLCIQSTVDEFIPTISEKIYELSPPLV